MKDAYTSAGSHFFKQKLVSEGRVFGPFFSGLKKIKESVFYSELAKPKKNQRIM